MSEVPVTLTKRLSFIDEGLRTLMQMVGTDPVEGGLTVDGHDYWWYLEYGTGVHHEAESAVDAPAGLQRPDSIPSDAGGGDYYITAEQRPYMRFYWHKLRRWVIFKKPAAVHRFGVPPIRPGGFVRNAIFDAQMGIHEDLQNLLAQGMTNLTHKKLVDVVNKNLRQALRDVRRNTPIGSPVEDKSPGPDGHLRDAWGIEEAS